MADASTAISACLRFLPVLVLASRNASVGRSCCARFDPDERFTDGRDTEMFRAVFTLMRRIICAACLLILLICGAEVGVRVYEGVYGDVVCRTSEAVGNDPSRLAIPSRSFHQELKPLAKAVVECRDSNTEIDIHTNSLGLRGSEPTIPKPENVCRIVVLGDETIYAPETAESDHFCALLQHQLQQQTRIKIEVINAGIPGHCPLTEFLFYRKCLMSLRPDLVLLHFDWSDVADDHQIRRRAKSDGSGVPLSCPNAKYVEAKKVLPCEVWRQQFRLLDWGMHSLSNEWKQQLTRQQASSRDIEANAYAWLRDEHPEQVVPFRQAARPIADLADLCQSSYCQFVLFTSPKPWQVSPKCSRGDGVRLAAGVARDACYSNRAPFKVLAGYANNQKIPFVDCSAAIASGPEVEANFLRYAPRWSPHGHRQIADHVAAFLIEKVPGAWNSNYFQSRDEPLTQTDSHQSVIQWVGGQQSTVDHDNSRTRLP